MNCVNRVVSLIVGTLVCWGVAAESGQAQAKPHRVNLAFDRYYSYEELTEALRTLQKAYPKFLTLRSVGKSYQGRDIWVMIINNPDTGPEMSKAAMYIDGNIHGNEIQGGEVCLYTIWFLMENYGEIAKVTELVDRRVFYILPTVNPDGRAWWFDQPNTSSSSRSGLKPTDNDNDGLYDEDGYDDLDGDGEILQMRKKVPYGDYRVSSQDPRLMERVEPGEWGEYIMLGLEGIDNDGDGRINEDGPGGYDPNRNWPTDWQPNYIQSGAGDYPLSLPESRAVADFVLSHPNIAGVQAYHNSGGMILRGPGAEERGEFPAGDLRAYDLIGRKGESILPYYRYLTIWKDLYTVHGGFVNWTYEGLGIFSFTNELFSTRQYSPQDQEAEVEAGPRRGSLEGQKRRLEFNDLIELGQMFVPWHPYQHPTYGEIEIGGWRKWSSRVNPTFMLEELCHRNCAFTLYHADQMPLVEIREVEKWALGEGLYRVRATLANKRAIPTISQQAARHKLQRPDWVTITGKDLRVISAGFVRDRYLGPIEAVERHPEKVRLTTGIDGNDEVQIEWVVRGSGKVRIRFEGVKAGVVEQEVTL
ncbi:MAG: M14 family metallopeptidase [candidate division KSB1 bacterium]|nr:M14 family metallopeptidase [candidate division KSB1 bacterium]